MGLRIIHSDSDEGRAFFGNLKKRNAGADAGVERVVDEIIHSVRTRGDQALFEYTKRFDHCDVDAGSVQVTEAEIEDAYKRVPREVLQAIRTAKERIRAYHEKNKPQSWFDIAETGEILGQLVMPMERAGVYAPGGKAAYPSSVLMNIIPAKVAGVTEVIMATPPNPEGGVNSAVLAAAREAGADRVFKMGGAQAIAALAYGTETIPRADIIVGPGNIYVATAKRKVFGITAIDSVAGPSEILIIADDSANPDFAAADMLSQAEHDELASAVLITTSAVFADEVQARVNELTQKSVRKGIIERSVTDFGAIVVAKDIDEAIQLSNAFAPEHLEICTSDNMYVLRRIRNAGAIFLGNYTPEPIGDYIAGPNHILPTGGTARFFSPLSAEHFMKKSSVLSFEKSALVRIAKDAIVFAESEGLFAHADAIRERMK